MKGKKTKAKRDRAIFKKTANRQRKANGAMLMSRGGTRL